MSLIVVEGVDGSGKSTLLENLRLECNKRYFLLLRHSERPRRIEDIQRLLRWLAAADGNGLDIVIDRHPLISEPIYGHICRDHALTDDMYTGTDIVDILYRTVSRIIYCRPPGSVMLNHLQDKPQMAGVLEKFDDLDHAYDKAMSNLREAHIPIKFYSWPHYKGTLEQLFFEE